MKDRYLNRSVAGRMLAQELLEYGGQPGVMVLALPRGGVPVAHEIAEALYLHMDLWIVRKLGVPRHEELAMGAISLGGACYINKEIVQGMGIPEKAIDQAIVRESAEVDRRNRVYRQSRPAPPVLKKTVIVVDDGLATGATMRAAIESLRKAGAAKIVVAAPVGSADTVRMLAGLADKVVCPYQPEPFYGVGEWYEDFDQTSDDEVQDLLARHTELAA
jgi:predicted phosphoribosyltransferase